MYTTMVSALGHLEPSNVWKHFSLLCSIPRPSKGEQRIVSILKDWAERRGFSACIDGVGNLVIRKPSTIDSCNAPGLILQAHLDMVCVKRPSSAHRFDKDPIPVVCSDGRVCSIDTTLGADNGIGVALAMAALEDTSLAHGPLEVLLTVDEEDGMGGARGLTGESLHGECLINLDAERFGSVYVGCAGGATVNAWSEIGWRKLSPNSRGIRISVSGLRGGHSGLCIHEPRENAIRLLTRVVRDIETDWPLALVSLSGGCAKNAIPDSANAVVAIPPECFDAAFSKVSRIKDLLNVEFNDNEPGLSIDVSGCDVSSAMSADDQAKWLSLIESVPNGSKKTSDRFNGIVETSSNLGVVRLDSENRSCQFLVRSLSDSLAAEAVDALQRHCAKFGIRSEAFDGYPSWEPRDDSHLLQLCSDAYVDLFGRPPEINVIHAGLECGIIGSKKPTMEMLSFGPTVRGAHGPGESLEIESVQNCWKFLRAVISRIAERGPGCRAM